MGQMLGVPPAPNNPLVLIRGMYGLNVKYNNLIVATKYFQKKLAVATTSFFWRLGVRNKKAEKLFCLYTPYFLH